MEHEPGTVVLRATGRLTPPGAARLHLALTKQLATGAAVLVDLAGLEFDRPSASAVFPSALRAAGGRPTARLVLFGATEDAADVLRRGRATTTVPLAPDRAAALDLALRGRPRNVRARFCLPGRPTAGVVGDLVTDAVAPWGLDPLDATLAAAGSAQLVGRASEHGCDLVIEHDGRYLHLRVTDHHASGRHGPDGPTAVHRVALRTGRGASQGADAQAAEA